MAVTSVVRPALFVRTRSVAWPGASTVYRLTPAAGTTTVRRTEAGAADEIAAGVRASIVFADTLGPADARGDRVTPGCALATASAMAATPATAASPVTPRAAAPRRRSYR